MYSYDIVYHKNNNINCLTILRNPFHSRNAFKNKLKSHLIITVVDIGEF